MDVRQGGIFSHKASSVLLLAWFAFITIMFAQNWHPVTLMSRMLPLVPQDVIAGLVRLFRYGMPDLAMLCLLVLAAIGGGSLILSSFMPDIDLGQKLTLSFGLGLAALSYLTFFLGIAGCYNNTGLIIITVAIALLAVNGLLFIVRNLKGFAGRPGTGWVGILFFALLLVVGVFLAAKALRPAVFYDAITYHLGVPNYYLQEGGIGYIPYDSYSNFPFAAEMLYTLGMFVYGLKLAQLISVAVFLALAMLVYEFTRSILPDVPPALPALLVLLTPAFMENVVQYSNDLLIAYYSLMVVYCFFMLEKRAATAWIVLMGVFTGVCIGTKYIALVSIAVPAFGAVCWVAYKKRSVGAKAVLKEVMKFVVPAAVVASPWLVKNWIYTGNPFYPALFGLLGGEDMEARYYAVHTMNHPSGMGGLKALLGHPWRLFISKPGYLTANYRAASFLGPALLLFAPMLIFIRGVDPVIKKLCVYAAVLFVMWSMAFPLTRYLYPAIAAMTVAVSYALVRFVRNAPVVSKVVVVTVVTVCLSFDLCLGFFQVNTWEKAFGFNYLNETDDEYLLRRMHDGAPVLLQSLPVYEYINENAAEDAMVLIIGDAQHLYIKRRHLYTYLSAKNPYEIFSESGGDDKSVADYLKSKGITHIVFSPAELRRLERSGYTSFPEDDNVYIERFLESAYVKPLIRSDAPSGTVYLFEVNLR